jgi:hypothetical protein
MDIEIETRITQLLVRAARRRRLVPYATFHAIFPPTIALARRYAMLEAVASAICNLKLADYAALLCTASGLPGPDFYSRFKRVQPERYYAVLGADRNRALKLAEKRRFASEVRDEVYRHASAASCMLTQSEPLPMKEPLSASAVRSVLSLVLGVVLAAGGLLAAPRADAQTFSLISGARARATSYTWALQLPGRSRAVLRDQLYAAGRDPISEHHRN